MTHTVRVLRLAEGDLSGIYDEISRDSPRRAVAMAERILDRIESLGDLPNRVARPRDKRLNQRGYRFVIEPPYLVFYKIGPRRSGYRVFHGRRAY